ncbi:hypothetical protein MYCTH_2304906 [Thermothelomyces thermophilus ATCC 42464]|uniref:Uncharacterized protein n=1 Tax=Thermothelomyces thermophilus (strain ATCC 42464 / BCRC 31852 / DSM 1799) TaxID=573729 RepID=G2QBQ0_THET4|nr:uncharacterized protein MYCTH_2304906 [Thermothelomyces thermophilus ATCC 42464]AEO57993.1 hypothetical protein MYCTH_2304906 [Thermothelomyces thermophilus ATCC 42464]
MESAFNDYEKRFLLAEMIKLSPLDVGVLVDFVRSHGIQPDWMHMQLPGGRNMSQCLHAAEAMFNTPMAPPSPLVGSLKRKSLGDLPDYGANKRQAILSPGELSPHGFAPGPQSAPAAQPVNIQPRPNGYAPALQPAAPSVSAAPYNPSPTARRRGRPPKSAQSSWQISTYPSISPAPSATQPNSPSLQSHAVQHQPAAQSPAEPKRAKKALPEIAPRPLQALPTMEPGNRSPAVPGADYQHWRDETTCRDNYQLQATEPHPRERSTSSYTPIQPRARSPFPPSRDPARAASREPRHYTDTPPPAVQEPVNKETQSTATEQAKT